MRKQDVVLISMILGIAGMLFLLFGKNAGKGDRVVITLDGRQYGTFSLSEDREMRIESDEGYNIVVIEDGEVFIKDADCPDRYCVRQGKTSKESKSLICLPHKLVVEVKTADREQTDVDAVAQ